MTRQQAVTETTKQNPSQKAQPAQGGTLHSSTATLQTGTSVRTLAGTQPFILLNLVNRFTFILCLVQEGSPPPSFTGNFFPHNFLRQNFWPQNIFGGTQKIPSGIIIEEPSFGKCLVILWWILLCPFFPSSKLIQNNFVCFVVVDFFVCFPHVNSLGLWCHGKSQKSYGLLFWAVPAGAS